MQTRHVSMVCLQLIIDLLKNPFVARHFHMMYLYSRHYEKSMKHERSRTYCKNSDDRLLVVSHWFLKFVI